MAETNQTINTIIQLRHDSTDKWATEAGKATPLKPGEAAVEICTDGKAKIKIGTKEGDTFESAKYFGGSEAQVYQSAILKSTDEQDDEKVIEELTDGKEINNGDFAIVKRYITGDSGAVKHTSYVYDIDIGWAATDGNYSASNVFFKDNITITQSVGNVTTSGGTPKEIECKGKNINQLFEMLYASEDCKGTKISANPSVSWSVSSNASGEVGSTFTRPTATLTVSSIGSYTYKCKDSSNVKYDGTQTGVTFNSLKVAGSTTKADIDTRAEVIAATTNCNTNTGSTGNGGLVKDATISYTATSTEIPSNVLTDTKVYYYFGAAADSTASVRKPITNLGNFVKSDTESTTVYADGIRAIPARTFGKNADTDLDTKTWTAQGWRGWFQGYKAPGSELNVKSLTSSNIRGLMTTPNNGSFTKSIANVPDKTNQLIFACPKGKISYTLKSDGETINTGFTVSQSSPALDLTVKHTTADVAGYDGNNAIEYDVFYCNDIGFIGAQTVTVKY